MNDSRKLPLKNQLALQTILLFITFIVLFPILWIVSLSLDPRGISRPTELILIPQGASLQAYKDVLAQPTANPVSFAQLAMNSLFLTGGVSLFAVGVAITAAYTFSRKHFLVC